MNVKGTSKKTLNPAEVVIRVRRDLCRTHPSLDGFLTGSATHENITTRGMWTSRVFCNTVLVGYRWCPRLVTLTREVYVGRDYGMPLSMPGPYLSSLRRH